MRLVIPIILAVISVRAVNGFIWLPFANLGSIFETLKQTAFSEKMDFNEPDSQYSFLELGKDLFNNFGQYLTSAIGHDDKMKIATNLRELFNLTTTTETPKATRRFKPKIIPVDKPDTTTLPTARPVPAVFTFPYTAPQFSSSTQAPETTHDPRPRFRYTTTTEPQIIKFVKTTKPSSTTTEEGIIKFTTTERVRYATFSPNIPVTTTTASTSTSTIPSTTTRETTAIPTTTTTTPITSPTSATTFLPETETPRIFTKPTYQIWSTTTTTPEAINSFTDKFIRPSSIFRNKIWKKVTPLATLEYTPSVHWTTPMTTSTDLPTIEEPSTTSMTIPTPPSESQTIQSSTAGVPLIIKAKKFTRPPINEKIVVTSTPPFYKYETCSSDQRCSIKLKSFETSDPLFQYCYSHSTMIEDSIQDLLRDTQTAPSLPTHISWHSSVTPEVVQLIQTLLSLYRPSRCLVIGVFTGLGLLGVAERVDSRGIVVALEHPAYAVFWDTIGQKHARKLAKAQMSRIQMRTSESIEKSLPRLAANEPNTFDFVFLDDFKRENYLDDYEHAIRLIRSGGLLVINQALNGGGVLSSIDHMTNDDRVIRNMNIRIKQDSRVSASLLPYGGGTWIITKN